MRHCLTVFCLYLACAALGLLCCARVQASTVPPTALASLATAPQWLALLHMQKNALTGTYHSEVDAKDFFLSGKKDDSEAELNATLQALRSPIEGNGSAWCRFPARAQFLTQYFSLHKPENLHCSALDYWRSRFSAEEITLVYPDPYLKKIASIFGHTFLRIDARDKNTHPVLLSQTISYYADVGAADNSTVRYIAKGLTGHFPGIIDLAPYFEKLRAYSDDQDRDIREYRLIFTPEKVRLFVDHVWEVRGSSFNYFFLDENCSYRLISLLDVITPTHNLRTQFTTHTIPVDTVKALQAQGLIANTQYIPSARKRFYAQLAQLTPSQQVAFKKLLKTPATLDNVNDSTVLALAENYRSIQVQVDPAKKAPHNLQVNQLVQHQYQIKNSVPAVKTPITAAEPTTDGHDMLRLQTGWQHDSGKDYLVLGGRFAYHDFHDPLPAFQKGVQLEVLDFQLRLDPYQHDDRVSLDRIRWFAVQSYNPSDVFFQDASWGLSAARQRELIHEKTSLVNIAEGYRGITKNCGNLLCHAEIIGGALTGSALDHAWDMRAGARAGLLYQTPYWSWSADMSQQYYLINDSDKLTTFQTEAGYRLTRDLSVYFSYAHQETYAAQRDQFLISLRSFF